MANNDCCFILCSFFCCIIMISPIIALSIYFVDYFSTPFSWFFTIFSWCFWLPWKFIYLFWFVPKEITIYLWPYVCQLFWISLPFIWILIKYVFFYILPYIFIGCGCHQFLSYIFDKIFELKALRDNMMKRKDDVKLEEYVKNLDIMKKTIFSIFGFLFLLKVIQQLAFQDSLIIQILIYLSVGVLLGLLLVGGTVGKVNIHRRDELLIYNCILIFLSSIIIDDSFQILTGIKIIF